MRLWLLLLITCLTAIPGKTSETPIGALLRSMVDGGPLTTDDKFSELISDDALSQLSDDNVREILPVAQKLLKDLRPEARKFGLMFFLDVTLRRSSAGFFESTDLLEPYVPDLLAIVGDRSSPLRRMAFGVLVYTKPKVSPKTIAYFSAHMSDKDNTVDDVNAMAWTLLEEGSDSLTQRVIAFVRGQSDPKVIEAVLRCFLVFTAKNSDALAYIGSSLDNPDVWVRRRAVEALQRLPLVARSPFLEQLNRLATDPKEPAEVRSEAAEALKK